MIDPTALVEPGVVFGKGTRVWGLTQIRAGARLGSNCVVGRSAYIGPGVQIGDRVKIQNLALVYEPAFIEDGVFIGPAAVFTNDEFPRAVTPSGDLKSAADWSPVGVTVREGASIGARAVCVAPVVIGRWAMVGAGAIVVADVPDHALVVGSPARRIGWVGRSGRRLVERDGQWACPESEELYAESDGVLTEVTR